MVERDYRFIQCIYKWMKKLKTSEFKSLLIQMLSMDEQQCITGKLLELQNFRLHPRSSESQSAFLATCPTQMMCMDVEAWAVSDNPSLRYNHLPYTCYLMELVSNKHVKKFLWFCLFVCFLLFLEEEWFTHTFFNSE